MQACKAVSPEVREAAYALHLEKAASQEEFIRGSMPHNPYSSAEVGPTMRDVKNFICRQMDMEGASLPCQSLGGGGGPTENRAA